MMPPPLSHGECWCHVNLALSPSCALALYASSCPHSSLHFRKKNTVLLWSPPTMTVPVTECPQRFPFRSHTPHHAPATPHHAPATPYLHSCHLSHQAQIQAQIKHRSLCHPIPAPESRTCSQILPHSLRPNSACYPAFYQLLHTAWCHTIYHLAPLHQPCRSTCCGHRTASTPHRITPCPPCLPLPLQPTSHPLPCSGFASVPWSLGSPLRWR